MGNFGPNRQLREFHRLFTHERDHRVTGPERRGSGNLGGWYACTTCNEMVERSGRGFRHRAMRRRDVP